MKVSLLTANLRLALTGRKPVLAVSDSVEELLGFSAEDFLAGRVQFQDLLHAADSDIAKALFSPESPGNFHLKCSSFNIRLRHADGKIRCVRGECRRQVGPNGEGVVELALRDARSLWEDPGDRPMTANFRAMLEDADDFIFFKDRNHVLTCASQNLIAAMDPEHCGPALLGLTDYDVFPENLADAFYAMEKRIFEGAPVAHEIQEIQFLGGKKVWLDNRKYPIRGDDGEITGLFGIARDITERLEATEKLKESEESLREAQRIAGLGSYVLDFGAGTWSSSEVMDEIFGIGKEYARTVEGWTRLVHPEDREAMTTYFKEEVIGQTKPFDKEYRIIRQNDQVERWVHGLGRLQLDEEGHLVSMHGTNQDITERREAGAALRQSKDLLKLFIDHAPAGMAMFDREMRYLAASQRWIKDRGLDGQSIIGRLHYESSPYIIPEHMKEAHRRGMAGEATGTSEDRIESIDGTEHWLRWEAIPWFTADGGVGGIVIFSVDITEKKRAEEALRQREELLHLLIEHAPAALSMYDSDLRFLAASQRWRENYSIGAREVVGHHVSEIIPWIPEHMKEALRRGLTGETTIYEQDRLERPDGSTLWLKWEARPWQVADGSVRGVIVFSENITSQKETEDKLRLSANVFTHAREGILITECDGTILEVNDSFTRITGYTREEVLGRSPRMLKSGLQNKEFYDALWQTLTETGQWSGEIWDRTKSGRVFPEMLTISAVRDASGTVQQYVALFSDITELKEHESKLEQIAHYDMLTGLPNRVLLADRMRQAMAQAQRRKELVAVAYLDLDGFKAVNDRHGHAAGDQLLTVLAERMKHALREGDTLARLGGDEFVAVLLGLPDTEASVAVLLRLLNAAAETAMVGELALRVSASVGVTFFPQPEEADADQLLRQADQAMYQAKLSGRNRFHFFDSNRDRRVRGHFEDLERIRQALTAHEFVLHYQPVVNLRTGALVGAEALIRWDHPERGLLLPAFFLPVIEEHPLSVALGEWVIETALVQMESWKKIGLNLPVSVNVGAQQLQRSDFVRRLGRLLGAHPAIAPCDLELEILENSALRDMTQVSQMLSGCRNLGVSLALDDFGTGYSSLTYLKHLPTNVLKIDQSFVREMLDDVENLSILEGILGLATAFGRKVVAEGVETVEHGLLLLQLGCEMAQGYGIALPMPADEVSRWKAEWRPDPRYADIPSLSFDDRPLLYAGIEHRAWIVAFEAFLHGKRHSPPGLDPQRCRLGVWLDAEKQSGRATPPAFQALEAIHRQVHALTAEILASHPSGKKGNGLGHLDELHALRDELLARLKTFRQQT